MSSIAFWWKTLHWIEQINPSSFPVGGPALVSLADCNKGIAVPQGAVDFLFFPYFSRPRRFAGLSSFLKDVLFRCTSCDLQLLHYITNIEEFDDYNLGFYGLGWHQTKYFSINATFMDIVCFINITFILRLHTEQFSPIVGVSFGISPKVPTKTTASILGCAICAVELRLCSFSKEKNHLCNTSAKAICKT